MDHEIIKQHPVEQEGRPIPGYAAVKEALDELEERATPTAEAIGSFYRSAPPDIQLIIDKLEEDYICAVNAARDEGKPQPDWYSAAAAIGGLPEEFIANIIALESFEAEAAILNDELQRHAPEKAREVAKKAASIEACFNYEKMAAEMFAGGDETDPSWEALRILDDIALVIAARELLSWTTELPEFYRLEHFEEILSCYEEDWYSRGLLELTPTNSHNSTSLHMPSRQWLAMKKQAEKAYEVIEKYGYALRSRESKESIWRFGRLTDCLAEEQKMPDVEDVFTFHRGRVYNEQLARHVHEEAAKRLPAHNFEMDIDSSAYETLVEKMRAIDANEALDNIEIVGSLDTLPFEYSKAELRSFLLKALPPLALKAVRRIVFRPMTEEENKEGRVAGLARRLQSLGGVEIIISNESIHRTYEYYQHHAAAREIAKYDMEETIVHEFAHALENEIPVAALKYWEECTADMVYVTDYVKDYFEQDHPHCYSEDFAESMALYVMSPGQLFDKSPLRYMAMDRILKDLRKAPPAQVDTGSLFDRYI